MKVVYLLLGQLIRATILAGVFAFGLRLLNVPGVYPAEINFGLLMIIGYLMDTLRSVIDTLVMKVFVEPAQKRKLAKADIAALTREYIAQHGVDMALLRGSVQLMQEAHMSGDPARIKQAKEVAAAVKEALGTGVTRHE